MTDRERLFPSGIIAVVRRVPVDRRMEVIQALVAGGIRMVEVTLDSEAALTSIAEAKVTFGETVRVGAGTVLDDRAAFAAVQAGADFLFSPILDRGMIEVAHSYGKIAIPGVFTPTEVLTAIRWGTQAVKLFPASAVGPQFIRELLGPFPQVSVIPTGGIHLDNVEAFIRAGAAAVGVGSSLIPKDLVESKAWDSLKALAKKFVDAVAEARNVQPSA